MIGEIYENIRLLSERLVALCTENGVKISAAESCTGGMISAAVTSVPGSSAVIELGVCSYSNAVKHAVLGVSGKTLDEFSEYSIQCAEEMALGALRLSNADLAVSTSGICGPSGGTPDDPVGTVYICVCDERSKSTLKCVFDNRGRENIRAAATEKALRMLLEKATEHIRLKGEI